MGAILCVRQPQYDIFSVFKIQYNEDYEVNLYRAENRYVYFILPLWGLLWGAENH